MIWPDEGALGCDGAPEISIALLTRNAGPMLGRIFHAIASQRTGRRVEVVAVDSGSTDGTVQRLESAGARVIRVAPESFNFGTTRDAVYEHARGAIVVNLSQDAIPAHELWLEHLLAPLNDPEVAVSCGRSVPDAERDAPQFPWERNGHFYFTREMRRFARRHGRGISFANSAVRRSVWERNRFEPQILGEDFQFQVKLNGEGFRCAFPEGAEVFHHHDYSTASLYRRCRDEGVALRALGCAYTELDLVIDLVSARKYVQWLREIRYGRLHSTAAVLFPWLRPVAVYAGSRFGARGGDREPPREAVTHG